jgi:hypothetical protein
MWQQRLRSAPTPELSTLTFAALEPPGVLQSAAKQAQLCLGQLSNVLQWSHVPAFAAFSSWRLQLTAGTYMSRGSQAVKNMKSARKLFFLSLCNMVCSPAAGLLDEAPPDADAAAGVGRRGCSFLHLDVHLFEFNTEQGAFLGFATCFKPLAALCIAKGLMLAANKVGLFDVGT